VLAEQRADETSSLNSIQFDRTGENPYHSF
jgi:hypothetical protein